MDVQASVIIPTFEDWPGLRTCLDCLAGQTVGQQAFEVIIANNNHQPEVPSDLRLPPNARLIHVEKPGSYAARNAALREARADALFFTDSDCLPDARWIEAGLARLAGLGPLDRVAGAVQHLPNGPAWTAPELYDRVNWLRQKEYAREGWGATANLIARRAIFDLAGPFDETLLSLGDHEWNMRAQALGSSIVHAPEALVSHPARATFAELARKRRRFVGTWHLNEVSGKIPRRSLWGYLSLVDGGDLRRTLTHPGLTGRQRLQILWIAYRLGLTTFAEIVRLRYRSASPQRS